VETVNAEGLALFLGQLIFLALIIERSVAQLKNIVRFGFDKPWPLIACVFSLAVVWGWQLPLVEMIVGIKAEGLLARAVDTALLSLWIGGGAAAIINTAKKAIAMRKELPEQTK